MTTVVRDFAVIEVEQQTDAWRLARIGRLTGSQAYAVVAKGRAKHEESTLRRNLRIKLALERVTSRIIEHNGFVTEAMQAGLDREALAIAAYEALTGELVQRAGFLEHRTLYAGCSVDGYVGCFDRLVSIKCRQPPAHYDFLRSSLIPPDALAQMQHEAWVTGAEAVDYFCWNPDFPAPLQSKLVTLRRDQLDIPGYEAEALKFLAEVDSEVSQLQHLAEDADHALYKA